VCHLARQHVTVALSGDGGDELLGGYRRYFNDRRDRRFLLLPSAVRRGMGRVARHFPEWMPARKYLQYIGKDALARYFRRVGISDGEVISDLIAPEVLTAASQHDPLDQLRAADSLSLGDESVARFTRLDYQNYLPNDILVKVDRMSMASALEVRAPFLDHHLVELVFSFPEEFRALRGETKRVLRAAVEPLLPPGTLQKPKHGFSAPIGRWFRNQVTSQVEDVLFDRRTRARGLWSESTIRKLLCHQRSGRADHSPLLWALLCFELWHRQLLDGEGPF
jgi:asparagine synthase (glutamine-hydrolysing)